MGYDLEYAKAERSILFFMEKNDGSGDGLTGLTPTVKLRKAGGSGASPSGAVSEVDAANMPGWYEVAGNATDTDTVGPLSLYATGPGALPAHDLFNVKDPDPDVLFTGVATAGTTGTITLDANTPAWFGNDQTLRPPYGLVIRLLSGTGAGQWSYITSYDTNTRQLTPRGNFYTAPTAGTRYAIMSAQPFVRLFDASLSGAGSSEFTKIAEDVWTIVASESFAETDEMGYLVFNALSNPESGITLMQAVSAILAAAVGTVAGMDTHDPVFKSGGGNTTRISATTDSYGNRSAVTLNLPPLP